MKKKKKSLNTGTKHDKRPFHIEIHTPATSYNDSQNRSTAEQHVW